MSEQIEHTFIKQIQDLYEVDIGDFKRKAITYLYRLEENMNEQSLKYFFEQMKTSIICNNTREIEVLREQIIQQMKKIQKS